MASYISHYLAAKAVTEKSRNPLIREYADCFTLGAQGGDLLFYAFGEFKGYGARTHREKISALFSAALDYCRAQKRPEPLAYTLGLLCHYALDSAAHPYVIHEAENRLPSLYPEHLRKCLHMMLETRLDCLISEKAFEKGEKPDLKEIIPSTKRAAKSLADVWYNAIDKVYGVDVPYKLLCKLPSRMNRYQRVFLKPHSLSCAVLRFAAKKLHYPSYITGFFLPDKSEPEYDFANLKHRDYPVFVGAEKTESLSYFEIFDSAVEKSVELIRLFSELYESGENADPSLFKVSFSGYLSKD